jgi:soluble lytic murein transglycosylase-like protein
MKSAVIALFLGCSALFFALAVQSGSLPPAIANHSTALDSALEQLKILFPLRGSLVQLPPPVLPRSPSAVPISKEETLSLIASASSKYKVPAAFIISIVAAESNFNSMAISPKGAIGLMQLMPDTAQEFGDDAAIPSQNVDAGTRYLRWLMDRYKKHQNSVIAAYNAGPGNVDRYHGVPPFRETRNYVTRVLKFLKQFSPAPIRVRDRWLMARQMQYFPR